MIKDQKYQFIKGQDGKVSIAGLGSYGKVKLARNSETKEIVAIKMIFKNAKQEIDVHNKLNHPNIIKLLNYNYDKQKDVTYMILEYAEVGTLSDRIKFGLGQLSKKLIRKYFRDVCEAVKYLHINNYMHRDIKPQNILLSKDQRAKLCDFGFAALCEYRSTLCGTYEYMSPQMIQKKPYDHKIDVWALGILLFQMINGIAPFRGDSGQQVIAQMKKPLIFGSRFQPDEIDLIKKILRVNADKRPTIQQILQHSYFNPLSQSEESMHMMSKSERPAQKVQMVEQQSFKKRNTNFNNARSLEPQGKSQLGFKMNANDQKGFAPYMPKTALDSKGIMKQNNYGGSLSSNVSIQRSNTYGNTVQHEYSSSVRKNQSIGNVTTMKPPYTQNLNMGYGVKTNSISQVNPVSNYIYSSQTNIAYVQPQVVYNPPNYPSNQPQTYQSNQTNNINSVGRTAFVPQTVGQGQNSIFYKEPYLNNFARKMN